MDNYYEKAFQPDTHIERLLKEVHLTAEGREDECLPLNENFDLAMRDAKRRKHRWVWISSKPGVSRPPRNKVVPYFNGQYFENAIRIISNIYVIQ